MSSTFRFLKSAFVLFSLVVLSQGTLASMIVQQSIVYFQPGDPIRQDIKITNPDPEPLYIQVEIKEVINPGMPNEVQKVISNPKESGFLVTPNRLAIQPGSQQSVRLVNLKGMGDSERVYRVALKPVAADVEATETGVKVLIGYELLVLIQPMAPKVNILHTREGNKLTLENAGNVDVLLGNGTQCKDSSKKECQDLSSYRLYPGNKVVVDLKYPTPVNFIMTTGMSNQAVTY